LIFADCVVADEYPDIATKVTLIEGLEFVMDDTPGCRTPQRAPSPDRVGSTLKWGSISGTGDHGIRIIRGCWERLEDGAVRIYMDEFIDEFKVFTIPADKVRVERIIRNGTPPPITPPTRPKAS
jgi:hypothetical protein